MRTVPEGSGRSYAVGRGSSADQALGADAARLRLVDHLAARPDLEDSASNLSEVVGLADSTTNHHLKQLLNAGLVSKRRDGMNVHYRLTPASLGAIARVLNATCC